MVSLMEHIYTAIDEHTNLPIYAGKVPINAKMPYITYSLPATISTFGSFEAMLKIDIWDNKEDTEMLETKSEELFMGLDKYTKTDNFVGLTIYADSVMDVPDPEVGIHHKQLNFNVIAYVS